jgi:hypothetical protein
MGIFFLSSHVLGTIWNEYDNKEKTLQIIRKLTFKSGTGDAPDDWYVVYADKNKFT